jgi:putative oxygen-independent coproporphyrinogen III oxidase
MSGPTLPPLGLYIHFPWCEKKCPYCDFNSHESDRIPESEYIDSLLSDLDRDLVHVQGRPVQTLFIGGGTPSLMSAASVMTLMRGISERVNLSSTLEATMEANPGSAEVEKFGGFRDAGINRLSLGIQSFQDDKLQQLGRIHSGDQAHRAIELAKKAGFANFNLDLMHGLPQQTIEQAHSDLKDALSHQPAHLSWYQLTIEPNTVFHNRPPTLPYEDTLADIQHDGEQLLAGEGMAQYEVSAYARDDKLRCNHNLNYWEFGDYLGIGAGAHGKVTREEGQILRYAKRRQPKAYLGAEEAGYIASSRLLARGEIAGEYILNALRLNRGFSLDSFAVRTGLSEQSLQPVLDSLIEKGLLRREGARISTTVLGARFLDTTVAAFFP